MESIESISKGCFVFKKSNKRETKGNISTHKTTWYKCYKNVWSKFEENIKKLRHKIHMNVLQDVIVFMQNAHVNCDMPLPVAVLITGINQPDHAEQINSLAKELTNQVTSHISILFARDCLNIKNAVENMVMQFLSNDKNMELPKLKKYQCHLPALRSWYQNCYMHKHSMSPSKKQKTKPPVKPFVVIIPDFESFNAKVLQDLILLLSSYSSTIPFVLLFGVATSISTVHKTLPHHITSKMFLQIFSSQSSTKTLHQILDNIILDPMSSFHLSGSTLKLLIDVFMFYDLSVEGFLNSIKYCMLHHYSNNSSASICTETQKLNNIKNQLNSEDIENMRKFLSFRRYVESQEDCQTRIDLLTKDEAVCDVLPELISNVKHYLVLFYVNLKILFQLISGLPQSPLGNQLYMLYIKAMTVNITEENDFKECIQLLNFVSKREFMGTITNILNDLEKQRLITSCNETIKVLNHLHNNLNDFLHLLNMEEVLNDENNITEEMQIDILSNNMSRNKMREVLLENSKQKKSLNHYDKIRKNIIDFLVDNISQYLQPPTASLTFYELFICTDLDSIKERIIGTPRAALHVALNSPNFYLQCSCCVTESKDEIIPTMPDVCVAYKLHLECGRLINLYDWLHAFRHIVSAGSNANKGIDNENEDDFIEIEPEIQARFTTSVAELQHLGFIKSSNKKRDHVTRLTW